MEALGISLGYLIVQILNFAVLFVVINAWAVKPIVKMLENRRKAIAQGLEDARVAEDARANAEREAEKILAEAQRKAAEAVREATERADAATMDIRAEAEAEIEKTRAATLVEIEQERERSLSDMRGQIGALAIAAAQRLISDALMQDEARQHALLQEFFSGVNSGKVTVLEGQQLSGQSAEVTSALPLTAEEQDIVRKDVLSAIGESATISFRVDPSILGGIIVRVGDRIIDGSVAGQLQDLRQTI